MIWKRREGWKCTGWAQSGHTPPESRVDTQARAAFSRRRTDDHLVDARRLCEWREVAKMGKQRAPITAKCDGCNCEYAIPLLAPVSDSGLQVSLQCLPYALALLKPSRSNRRAEAPRSAHRGSKRRKRPRCKLGPRQFRKHSEQPWPRRQVDGRGDS